MVRRVLKDQAYPWYDVQKDRVIPLLPDPSSWTARLAKRLESFFDWLGLQFGGRARQAPAANRGSLRGVLATLLFLAAGGVLLVMLFQLWRIHTPQASTSLDQVARIGDAARMAGLAPGVAMEGTDPWAEALRRRAAGDSAGAVIWLFLDQLLSLQRAGLIRLTPGRTAQSVCQRTERSAPGFWFANDPWCFRGGVLRAQDARGGRTGTGLVAGRDVPPPPAGDPGGTDAMNVPSLSSRTFMGVGAAGCVGIGAGLRGRGPGPRPG